MEYLGLFLRPSYSSLFHPFLSLRYRFMQLYHQSFGKGNVTRVMGTRGVQKAGVPLYQGPARAPLLSSLRPSPDLGPGAFRGATFVEVYHNRILTRFLFSDHKTWNFMQILFSRGPGSRGQRSLGFGPLIPYNPFFFQILFRFLVFLRQKYENMTCEQLHLVFLTTAVYNFYSKLIQG